MTVVRFLFALGRFARAVAFVWVYLLAGGPIVLFFLLAAVGFLVAPTSGRWLLPLLLFPAGWIFELVAWRDLDLAVLISATLLTALAQVFIRGKVKRGHRVTLALAGSFCAVASWLYVEWHNVLQHYHNYDYQSPAPLALVMGVTGGLLSYSLPISLIKGLVLPRSIITSTISSFDLIGDARNRQQKAYLVGFLACGSLILTIIIIGIKVGPHQRDEELRQRRQEARDYLSKYRVKWLEPSSPDFPVRINSPFGLFSVPLEHMAARGEFLFNHPGYPLRSLSSDGYFHWNSFAITYWMPGGEGVVSEPSYLVNNLWTNPVNLKTKRMPFRPKEFGRKDPSRNRYVVVVAEFCPYRAELQRDSQQGLSLAMSGFGYGALSMYGCATQVPPPEWHPLMRSDPNGPTVYCRPEADFCFGWFPLAGLGVRALTYFPSDATDFIPDIAMRMTDLMNKWQKATAAR